MAITRILLILFSVIPFCLGYDYCGNDYYCDRGHCCQGGYHCCYSIYQQWWFWVVIVVVICVKLCCIGCCYSSHKKKRANAHTGTNTAVTAIYTNQPLPANMIYQPTNFGMPPPTVASAPPSTLPPEYSTLGLPEPNKTAGGDGQSVGESKTQIENEI